MHYYNSIKVTGKNTKCFGMQDCIQGLKLKTIVRITIKTAYIFKYYDRSWTGIEGGLIGVLPGLCFYSTDLFTLSDNISSLSFSLSIYYYYIPINWQFLYEVVIADMVINLSYFHCRVTPFTIWKPTRSTWYHCKFSIRKVWAHQQPFWS